MSAPDAHSRIDERSRVLGAGLVHHPVHRGDPHEHRRPAGLDRVERDIGTEAWDHVHRDAQRRRLHEHGEAGDVRDRHPRHRLVAAQARRERGADRRPTDEGAVRELGALGLAGGPRCIEERGDVVGIGRHRLDQLVAGCGLELDGVAHDEGGGRVVDHVVDLGGLHLRIDRHRHPAGAGDGLGGEEHPVAVRERQHDPVAGGDVVGDGGRPPGDGGRALRVGEPQAGVVLLDQGPVRVDRGQPLGERPECQGAIPQEPDPLPHAHRRRS